jgi:hypothetical protein
LESGVRIKTKMRKKERKKRGKNERWKFVTIIGSGQGVVLWGTEEYTK